MISIVTDPGLEYPSADDSFSPSERYPEYRFPTISRSPNAVYAKVRELLRQAGLDRERFDTPEWNPLRTWIAPGSSVFVLCNFVYHKREIESRAAFLSKCTHGSVLRAVLDYVLLATGPGGAVRFGNAPVQSCDWERVLSETGAAAVEEFYRAHGAPVASRDLRLWVVQRDALGRLVSSERRPEEDNARRIDLGDESLLAEVSGNGGPPRFRVHNYDPDRTAAFHRSGSHVYVVHRAVLDADVVVSLLKLKTHGKVGVTCALKGFVGSVAHKDCLAHHRFGSPGVGGDEYPSRLGFLRPLSALGDWINRRRPEAPLQGLLEVGERSAWRVLYRTRTAASGSWYGNDTCWRMALDLARIARYAGRDGRMSEQPQRGHLAVIDGVVGGEGDGPLSPTPARAGTLVLGDDLGLVDRIACRLMGYDPARVPLVRRAFEPSRFPVTRAGVDPVEVIYNGASVAEDVLPPSLGRPFRTPLGWDGRVERGA